MGSITLRQLQYFQALASQGHFGRAADISSISQPALSVQIKDLEETLQVSLFERSPKQVRLTAFGEEFALRVNDILRSVGELEDLARASRDQLSGRLRIGVIPTIAPYLLPKILARLTKEFEGLDVHIRETVTPRLVQELSDGKLDAAIVALPVFEPTFTEVELFSETLVLVRPATDQQTPVPTRDELRDMRVLILEEGHCFRDQALSFCSVQSPLARERLDGSSLSTLVQMVGSGIGVTLIPEMAIDVETGSAAVSVARFQEPQPTRTIGMVWRKTSPLAPQLAQISQIVQTCAGPQGK